MIFGVRVGAICGLLALFLDREEGGRERWKGVAA
jgi:hypothetical protein